jgi:hypothetical protein
MRGGALPGRGRTVHDSESDGVAEVVQTVLERVLPWLQGLRGATEDART